MNWKAGLCRTPLSKWASLPIEFCISLSLVNVPSPVSSPSLYRQASNGVKFTRADPEAQINWTSVPNFLWKKTYSKWIQVMWQSKGQWLWWFVILCVLRSISTNEIQMIFLWPRLPTQVFREAQSSYTTDVSCWSVPEVKPHPETESSLGNLGGFNGKLKQKRVTIESLLLSAA